MTNSSALVKSFHAGDENEFKNLTETWAKIVEENAKFCEMEVPGNKTPPEIPRDEEGITQYNLFYYTNIVECIRKWNFVKCPDIKKNKECDELKGLMEKCNNIDYPLTHKLLFEDFYYRNISSKYGEDKTLATTAEVTATEEVTKESN